MRFKQILIVGVGLIGGSFALAAKRAKIAERVTGYDYEDVLKSALARGIIDEAERCFDSGSRSDADLVYLAAPVGVGREPQDGRRVRVGAPVLRSALRGRARRRGPGCGACGLKGARRAHRGCRNSRSKAGSHHG